MKFKGTKGQWFVNERFLQVGTKQDNDKSVLNDGTICRFHLGTKNYQSDKETAYNALLISKAPEILEMLIQIADGKIRPREYQSEEDIVRKLIYEATEV